MISLSTGLSPILDDSYHLGQCEGQLQVEFRYLTDNIDWIILNYCMS